VRPVPVLGPPVADAIERVAALIDPVGGGLRAH
jgi:hypothetical protein